MSEKVILWQEVVVMSAGAAMEHNDERTVAPTDSPREQLHYNSTASASATSFTSACSRSPKPPGTSESMSICPRI